MTRLEVMQKTVSEAIVEELDVVILFKDQTRSAVAGRFVAKSDAVELLEKCCSRFCTGYKVEQFEKTQSIELTRIFDFRSIERVRIIY